MPNYFYLTLDTLAPANPTISIEGGAIYASAQLVTATLGTSDSLTTGYQMKIWGDVDTTYDANIKGTEVTSAWIGFATTKQIKLTNTPGTKTISFKIRDDVFNESSVVTDTIIFDNSLPVVTTTTPDLSRVSKKVGKNIASFSFSVSEAFVEYKVKVVSSTGATHDTGALIPITNGSVNTSQTGSFDTTSAPISVQINGADLELASSGDGQKIVKVFVKDNSGNWSA